MSEFTKQQHYPLGTKRINSDGLKEVYVKIINKRRRCSLCNEILSLTDKYFYKNHATKDGFDYVCRNCRRESNIKRAQERAKNIEICVKKDKFLSLTPKEKHAVLLGCIYHPTSFSEELVYLTPICAKILESRTNNNFMGFIY